MSDTKSGGDGPTVISFSDFKGLKGLKLPGGGQLRWIVLVLLVLVLTFMAVFTIDPEEVGVVLRFGKFTRTAEPGLNFKMPLIEVVIKVPVQRQLKQEFGYRTAQAGVRSEYVDRGFEGESDMLTGDLNAAVVEWVVQYRVIDPSRYLFRVRNVDETLRYMSEAVMREVVGDRTVNEVLTVGRGEIELLNREKLQALCDQYETGVAIDQVLLQDVNPPEPVMASFNEVNEAEQEADRMRNQAEREYNEVVPRAEGEAQQTIQTAEGYAVNRVNRAQGEAARFEALYSEYAKAPEVTRQRMYLETLAEVLPKAGEKLVVDDDLGGVLPLLDVGGRAGGRRTTAAAAGGEG